MASRQSPSVIRHAGNTGLTKRCASNRRYAVAYVSTYYQKWNQKRQAYDKFTTPQQELVVFKRSDSLTTAYEAYNKLHGLQPIIWDLVHGTVVAQGN